MFQKISTHTQRIALIVTFGVAVLMASNFAPTHLNPAVAAPSKNQPELANTKRNTRLGGSQSSTAAGVGVVGNVHSVGNSGSTSRVGNAGSGGSAAAVERGEKVFKKALCVGCHAGGFNALMPDKPIKGAAFAEKYKSDQLLERTIRKGFPSEGMPPSGKDSVSESQMKDLILYIRSLTPQK